jgi:hypothetical protein
MNDKELRYFDCDNCGVRNYKSFDDFAGVDLNPVICRACKESVFPIWTIADADTPNHQLYGPSPGRKMYGSLLGRQYRRPEIHHQYPHPSERQQITDRPFVFQDHPDVEELKQKLESSEIQHSQEINSIRDEYEQRIESLEQKIQNYKNLFDLIKKRDEARSKILRAKSQREKRMIEERLADVDVKIAHLEDVMGFKLEYK